MKTLTLERAELYDVECPFTGVVFRVQFWDTHQEDRHSKRRMAIAVFARNPTFLSEHTLIHKTSHFWPAPSLSCDGLEAAAVAVSMTLATVPGCACYEDCYLDDEDSPPVVTPVDSSDEGYWLKTA